MVVKTLAGVRKSPKLGWVAPGAVGSQSEVTRTGLSPIGQSTNQSADLPEPANGRAGPGQVTGLGVVGLSSGWSVAMEQLVVSLLAASVAAQVMIFSPVGIVNQERGFDIGKVIHGPLNDPFRRQIHGLPDSFSVISRVGSIRCQTRTLLNSMAIILPQYHHSC